MEKKDEKGTVFRINCSVCGKKEGRYRCPRCLLPYCSVDCFRLHSVDCTEAFHRENVESALMATRPSAEEKKAMEDILIRHYKQLGSQDEEMGDNLEEGEEEEEYGNAIESRRMVVLRRALEILDSSDTKEAKEAEWIELTRQMEEIGISIASKDVIASIQLQLQLSHGHDVPHSTHSRMHPWWREQRKLVQMHGQSEQSGHPLHDHSIVPKFDQISKVRPSRSVMYTLALAIFTYCFTWRRYGGDFYDLGFEIVALVFDFLESHEKPFFESVVSVGDHCMTVLKKWGIDADGKDEWSVIQFVMVEDVRRVFSDRVYRVQAVLDLRSHIVNIMKAINDREEGDKKWRKRVQRALIRRIDYLIAYVRDVCQTEDVDEMLSEIDCVFQRKDEIEGSTSGRDGDADASLARAMDVIGSVETRKSAPKNPDLIHTVDEKSQSKMIEVVSHTSVSRSPSSSSSSPPSQ